MTRRLVVVSPTFHPEPIGTPVYATDLVRWFHRAGWDVEVVTSQPFYPRFERFPGYGRSRRHDLLDGSVPVLRLPTIVPRGGRASWRVVGDLNFALQGIARSGGHRADAVLSISPGVPWAALVGRALTRRGGRHVVLVHDVQSGLAGSLGMLPKWIEQLAGTVERFSLERAQHVTALTPEMLEELTRLGVRREMSVTPLWSTITADPDLVADGQMSVQYSGNFGEKQGVDTLDAIAASLQRRAPALSLLLRGAGPKFNEVRSRLQSAGLGNVTFEAPVSDSDLPAALARSAIHLVLLSSGSSRYALPSKVVNALTAGSLVVAMTDDGSPLHRLAAGLDGLTTVLVGEVEAVVDDLVRLVADRRIRERRLRSQQQAARVFDRDTIIRRLAALFEQ